VKITNEQNQTFGTFCGNHTGQVVYVSGQYAVVTFHSDSIFSGKGYRLKFSSVSQGKGNVSYMLFDKWKIETSQKKKKNIYIYVYN